MAHLRRRIAVALILALALASCEDDDPPVGESSGQGPGRALSGRGLYRDLAAQAVVPEAFAYTPDYELWSDGASKRRWMVLPAGRAIDSSDMAHWRFPVGTSFWKEFSRDGQRLETRLIEKIADTGDFSRDFFVGTFVWRPDQSDADLVEGGVKNVNGTDHEVPKQKICKQCHLGEPSGILGFSAVQLSRSGTLQALAESGWLSVDPGRTFELPGDDVERRALGVLHANCGHCHSATGSQPKLRLRFLPEEAGQPLESTEIFRSNVSHPVTAEWLDRPAAYDVRVVPGIPSASAVLYRMQQRGVPDQMPPVATSKVDAFGIAALDAWIARMPRMSIDEQGGPTAEDAAADVSPVDPDGGADAD
jgi:hypothetical protein